MSGLSATNEQTFSGDPFLAQASESAHSSTQESHATWQAAQAGTPPLLLLTQRLSESRATQSQSFQRARPLNQSLSSRQTPVGAYEGANEGTPVGSGTGTGEGAYEGATEGAYVGSGTGTFEGA